MPTDAASRRRMAVVLARHAAVAPPGIEPEAFIRACLADSYEVLAGLVDVDSGIAGPERTEELLWPGARRFAPDADLAGLAGACAGYDELVVVPGDVPDLPGLVMAKMFRALQRADVCVAPERGGQGCVGIGVRLPLRAWIDLPLDLDADPREGLLARAPRPNLVAVTPDWHRLRAPTSVHRLDPGLEGWEETRALLSGYRLET